LIRVLQVPQGYAFAGIRGAGILRSSRPWCSSPALLGAGSRPDWCPSRLAAIAHPAAPSHVSALMSGVMTKVRFMASCASSSTCSAAKLVDEHWFLFSVVSLRLGVLYALMQHDLKRLSLSHG
jgi:hydrogenase-4 component B